ncbi:MAG: hypothetical protein L0338_22610 [Acidobacteria bacterium]|nr:hypothetical protein [Acidobacteriota bacterium]
MAIFLLLWVAVDLFVPGICHTEEMESSLVQVATTVSPPGTSNDHGTRLDYEDDCFCCCSHIVHSPHFELSDVNSVSPANLVTSLGLPLGSAERIPHPPRS